MEDSSTFCALGVGLAVFVVALFFVIPRDLARARVLRYGRRLKGPELVSVGVFNRRNHSSGIGFVNLERSFTDRMTTSLESAVRGRGK